MNLDAMWRPEASYGTREPGHLPSSAEEGGRGSLLIRASSSTTSATEQDHEASTPPATGPTAKNRKKAIIPRRRTPTVCIPKEMKADPPSGHLAASAKLQATASGSSEGSTPTATRPGYGTIEKSTEPTLVLLEQSSKVYDETKVPNLKNRNWFCGWTDHEYIDLHHIPKPAPIGGEFDRSRLQTPAEGYRSAIQSRVSSSRYTSSRAGGRRTYPYTFHHYDNPDSHIETYRELYSYTALNTDPNQRRKDDDRTLCEGGDGVEQDAEIMLPAGVASLYRGDPYLKELMSRLGIRELATPSQEMERQQQLLQAPRPTPPSIVKRRRDEKESVSIIVANSAPKRYPIIPRAYRLYEERACNSYEILEMTKS